MCYSILASPDEDNALGLLSFSVEVIFLYFLVFCFNTIRDTE